MRGLFVTGTDTEVGKTCATSLIARRLIQHGSRVGCYKPVCSGRERRPDGSRYWADVEALRQAVGGEFPSERICPQAFDAPLAPPAAARHESREVDTALLRTGVDWWSSRVDVLLVEGVGGLLCPIAAQETVADLAGDLGFPLVIVSPLILGTINHTLMTLEVARVRELPVAGVLFNELRPADESVAESSLREIADRTSVPLLGVIPFNRPDELRPVGGLTEADWLQIAQPPGVGHSRNAEAGGC